MRNNKVAPEPAPAPKLVENDFPNLSTQQSVKVFGSTNGKSFANMASDWAVHRDEQKKVEELQKKEQESNALLYKQRRSAPLPHFHNIRHFVEPEDDEEEQEEKTAAPANPDEEGWVEVKPKKRRKQKTFEERMNRPPTPEERSEETVWNGNEEDDSYWK